MNRLVLCDGCMAVVSALEIWDWVNGICIECVEDE